MARKTKFSAITKEFIDQALDALSKGHPIPERQRSKDYFVRWGQRELFPPKYVIDLAAQKAGRGPRRDSFNTTEARRHLSKLGYKVEFFPMGDRNRSREPYGADFQSVSLNELRKRALKSERTTPQRKTYAVERIERSEAVAAYVKALAKGICDLCEHPAPFKVGGEPFLECHHLVHLADNGEDTILNAVALCPNCHRKLHQLQIGDDIQLLQQRVQNRIEPIS